MKTCPKNTLFLSGKKWVPFALLLSLFVFPALQLTANPNVFINQAEIDAIKAKIAANAQPWKAAYDKIVSEANSALNQSPLSVTFQGNSSHSYKTDSPYNWSNNMPSPCGSTHCDGQINPQADRGDYEAAIALGEAVRRLGLGYAFTGNSNYADKAIDLINAWALDSVTYMNASYGNTQSRIELSITMPALFFGADLIWNYPGWDSGERAAFASWVDSFVSTAHSWSATNNFENWRMVVIASGGALIGDSAEMNYAFDNWKALIPARSIAVAL